MGMQSLTYGMLAAALGLGLALPAAGEAQGAERAGYAVEKRGDYVYGPGWMVRLRALGVFADEDSSNWTAGGSPMTGADVEIEDAIVPELDISYFFTKNIAVELVLAVTKHEIDGTGPAIKGLGKIGDSWLLPPTLLLQYHFDLGGGVKPYVGAGVNYTFMFNEDTGRKYRDLELDDSWGFALQAGVDIHLRGNWFFNVDVKKLWLDTEGSVKVAAGGTPVSVDVDIDPWIVGVGVGYRFGGSPAPLK